MEGAGRFGNSWTTSLLQRCSTFEAPIHDGERLRAWYHYTGRGGNLLMLQRLHSTDEEWRPKGRSPRGRLRRRTSLSKLCIHGAKMASREQDRCGIARSPQLQDDEFCQCGRQDSIRRGEPGYYCRAVEGDGSAWVDYCGAAGGDGRHEGKGELCILRRSCKDQCHAYWGARCRQNTHSHDTLVHQNAVHTCHRTLQHDLSHLHHLSFDHLLPHCLVLPQLLGDWIKKPCEIHCGVADTLDLHLPQVLGPRWPNTVDRYTSHESFSRTLSPCAHTTFWLEAQGVFGAHSLHLHVIHDVTCLSVRCLFLFCPPLSRAFTFLSHFSLTVYLFSVLLINFHVVGTAED